MFTIKEIIDLCTEECMLKITIYSIEEESEKWSGMATNLPEEYEDSIVESFDVPDSAGYITFNID